MNISSTMDAPASTMALPRPRTSGRETARINCCRFRDGGRESLIVRLRPDSAWPLGFDRTMEQDGWYLVARNGTFVRHYVRPWDSPPASSR